ncbi:MAG: nitrogenase component 1 [Eubacteriales bacterium]|nr:nitrogenase component 1 [Eubacteriales bacterium]
MGKIFSKLPAFSADYSGAASVFYDMNGILVTYDAGSCAGSYWMTDEPRMTHDVKNIFSAGLREKKIILGADREIKEQIERTCEELGAECVSIFGTPVPTAIGIDFQGLSREVQKVTGLPVFGINTSGLDFYDVGQRKSYESLLEYCVQTNAENLADVNVIGATPLDMWDLNQIKDMIQFLKNAGAKNPAVWGANGKLREIGGADGAKLNIAVSVSAIPIVKEMNRKFGTPYLVGYPVGKVQTAWWSAEVHAILQKTGEYTGRKMKESCGDKTRLKEDKKVDKSILIIGEQVASNSLRQMLKAEFGFERVDVVSYFQMFEEYMAKNDAKLEWETDLTELLSERMPYDIIIGDPFYDSLLPYTPDKKIQLPHIAVSYNMFLDNSPNFFGEKGNQYFQLVL